MRSLLIIWIRHTRLWKSQKYEMWVWGPQDSASTWENEINLSLVKFWYWIVLGHRCCHAARLMVSLFVAYLYLRCSFVTGLPVCAEREGCWAHSFLFPWALARLCGNKHQVQFIFHTLFIPELSQLAIVPGRRVIYSLNGSRALYPIQNKEVETLHITSLWMNRLQTE